MGRENTGSIRWKKRGWVARLWVVVGHVDGKPVRERRSYDLGTDSKAIALAKLASIKREVSDGKPPLADGAKGGETFAKAVERIVPAQGRAGLQTWKERESRLNHYAAPHIGHLDVSRIFPRHIKEVADAAHASGKLGRESIVHLRTDMGTVFAELVIEGVIASNPVKAFRLDRKRLRRDKRRRVMLADDEFARLMVSPVVSEHVQMMSLTSRTFGGQRTSDLHAWDWTHIDTDTFAVAEVYRPKTDGPDDDAEEDGATVLEQLVIPDVLRGPLKAWWEKAGRPTSGPVFPVRSGRRAGQRQGKRSHARDLRRALWAAGIHRPLPGFAEALEKLRQADHRVAEAQREGRRAWWEAQRERRAAKQAAMALDALQTDTKRTRAIDFHSMRRQFCTAVARSGLNAQKSMTLAGHKNMQTHMRYVMLTASAPLETPASALPQLLPATSDLNSPESGLFEPPPMAAGDEKSAASFGDPNGIRTHITGVRGRRPNR